MTRARSFHDLSGRASMVRCAGQMSDSATFLTDRPFWIGGAAIFGGAAGPGQACRPWVFAITASIPAGPLMQEFRRVANK